MYTSAAVVLSALALVNAQTIREDGTATGELGDAQIVNGNPQGVTYTATLPDRDDTEIRGFISGTSNSNGTGVTFTVDFTGFPSEELGPYLYHVHDQPVPANGNCTATLAHQDSYIRGEQPPCNSTAPATCQDGDLSGKHGNITFPGLQTSYSDLYLSTRQGPGAFFGNRSVVVHTSNTTRLTCANFVLDTSAGNRTSTNTTTTSSPSPSPFTGGAATNLAAGTAVVGVLVAGLAFFM